MKRELSFGFVADGGLTSGIGHLRRSRALLDICEDMGIISRFFLPSEFTPKCSRYLTHVWIDLPYPIPETLSNSLDSSSQKIVALDPSSRGPFDLEIFVVNHGNAPKSGNVCVGLEYAIIRPEILAERDSIVNNGKVLVCLGGADVREVGSEVIQRLASGGVQSTWVLGPHAAEPTCVQEGIETFRNPDHFSHLLSQCSWAITNGGATAMELMFLGKPVHVLPQTNAEARLARLFLRDKAILGIGFEELNIRPSSVTLEKVGRNARTLIDGQGARRIIKEVLAL